MISERDRPHGSNLAGVAVETRVGVVRTMGRVRAPMIPETRQMAMAVPPGGTAGKRGGRMYAIFVSVKVKPEQRQRFLEVIEDDSICSVRDEPGCFRFDVLQDLDDPDKYYFYEVYRDEAAFEAHRQTPHLARWMAAAADCLVAPAERIRCSTVFPREYA